MVDEKSFVDTLISLSAMYNTVELMTNRKCPVSNGKHSYYKTVEEKKTKKNIILVCFNLSPSVTCGYNIAPLVSGFLVYIVRCVF